MKPYGYVEKGLRALLRKGEALDAQEFIPGLTGTPFTLVMDSLYHSTQGDHEMALTKTEDAFNELSNMFGCDDSYVDVAGALNDMAVAHVALAQPEVSLQQLKRALHMTERSYRVDTHLQTVLVANLMQVRTVIIIGTRTYPNLSTFITPSDSLSTMPNTSRLLMQVYGGSLGEGIIAVGYAERLKGLLGDETVLVKLEGGAAIPTMGLGGDEKNEKEDGAGATHRAHSAHSDGNGDRETSAPLVFIQSVHPELRRAESYFLLAESLARDYDHAFRFEESLSWMEQVLRSTLYTLYFLYCIVLPPITTLVLTPNRNPHVTSLQGFGCLRRLAPIPDFYGRSLALKAIAQLGDMRRLSQDVRGGGISTGHLDQVSLTL